MPARKLIQVFAREPVQGFVKTRLAKTLGNEKALSLYQYMLENVLLTARQMQDTDIVLYGAAHAESSHGLRVIAERNNINYAEQCGRDLGERQFNALRQGLIDYTDVLLIGTDCIFFSTVYFQQAFAKLTEDAPIVIGPAHDGGYVLIGARRVVPALFNCVSWGSEKVLEQIQANLLALRWNYGLLTALADIDDENDLRRFAPHLLSD
jgi:uncharacterized protein